VAQHNCILPIHLAFFKRTHGALYISNVAVCNGGSGTFQEVGIAASNAAALQIY
jgi:hypothetical protein